MGPTETMGTPEATKAGGFTLGDDTQQGDSLQDPHWGGVTSVFSTAELLNLDCS